MSIHGTKLGIYSVAHFLVDFCCALLLFSALSDSRDWVLCILLYNFCAFAMQMPIGLVADGLNRNSTVAALGCLLVAVAYGLTAVPLLTAIVAGIGNSMFHVGGGVDVLNRSEKHSAALGVFVSPGAFGIYFGTILGSGEGLPRLIPVAALIVGALALPAPDWFVRRTLHSENAKTDLTFSKDVVTPLIFLFLVVCLRSWVGMILAFPWKTGHWATIAICAVVFGKTAGGFLGDRIGMIKASRISLCLSAALFLLGSNPVAGVAAVFFFNMSMPITLWGAAKMLPGGKGFTFGLLTFALFLGFLPSYFGWPPNEFAPWVYAVGAFLSQWLLCRALKMGGLT